MAPDSPEKLPDEVLIALAHTGEVMRGALTIFFELDARLARLVAASSEPMLGQVRLAWWRDTLRLPVSERPAGDPILDAISAQMAGVEDAFIALVDGWEQMLSEPPLSRAAASGFAAGRAQTVVRLASREGYPATVLDDVQAASYLWALADAVSHISDGVERQTLLDLAREQRPPGRLLKPFRGLAVLAALGERAIKAGGAPLMAGRSAGLVAFRAALLGR
ncbi:MAG: hypothetical protein AAGG79_08105 [Pseudomonadota bacterium]